MLLFVRKFANFQHWEQKAHNSRLCSETALRSQLGITCLPLRPCTLIPSGIRTATSGGEALHRLSSHLAYGEYPSFSKWISHAVSMLSSVHGPCSSTGILHCRHPPRLRPPSIMLGVSTCLLAITLTMIFSDASSVSMSASTSKPMALPACFNSIAHSTRRLSASSCSTIHISYSSV